jgi:hypothetical protein
MKIGDFDTEVMPSARAARREERRMFLSWPAYLLIACLVGACVLAAGYFGLSAR